MFAVDIFNNVKRHCTLPGDEKSRRWVVRNYMVNGKYLLQNIDTKEYRTSFSKYMMNLY